jgi:acetyl esterase/lipase
MNPIRDDAILYGQVLEEANVDTKLAVYPELPHCWWALLPDLPQLKEATEKYRKETLEGMKWLLRKV